MTTTRLTTADDLLALGSDAPFILVHGRLVGEMPSGNQSSEIGALFVGFLLAHVRPRRLGRVYGADGGFVLSRDPDSVVAPDAAFIRAARLPSREAMGAGFVPVPPDLAVEVLSPTDRPGATERKLALYQEAQVPLVWVVDPKRRTVTVHAGEATRTLREGDTLDGGDLLPGFALPVADLFT